MINAHRYDAGWPRDDSRGCQVIVNDDAFWAEEALCGKAESEHTHSQYPNQRPTRDDVPQNVGAMHEPRPYLGELDWHHAGPAHRDTV